MTGHDQQLKLVYYGDDFTGSTDALDFLGRAGIPSVLFMDPPDASHLNRFPGIEAFGVSGMTRTMDPDNMRKTLSDAFGMIRDHKADFVHYKVCSTFDSSPETGNIGTAIRAGAETFDTSCVPILAGNPALGRFVAFGNLFARLGTRSTGRIYRIDQHPSMSRHPVTPSRDGDLRDHLARQTDASVALLDIIALEMAPAECERALETILQDKPDALLIDILQERHFATIGRLLDSMRKSGKPLFTVGSSGIEAALCRFWQDNGHAKGHGPEGCPPTKGPLLVASGSCSPVTSGQIDTALSNGFSDLPLDVDRILAKGTDCSYVAEVGATAAKLIAEGKSVIIHTSRGPEDPRLDASRERPESQAEQGHILGTALGDVVLKIIAATPVQRICFAGGDTSSHAARAMRIEAVEMVSPFQPGAPLCRAHSSLNTVDGLELNFKGGQVGAPDYFISLRNGNSTTGTVS